MQDNSSGKSTKELILKASMELFSEYGYKAASVRKIASKVGIRESALYNHFTNKEEIFKAVAATLFSTPTSAAQSDRTVAERAKDGKKFLFSFIVGYKLMTFDAKNERLFRILMIELLQNKTIRESFKNEFHNNNIKMLSEAFFVMMQADLIRSGDPKLMATEFLSPLFYIRLQLTLLKIDNEPTTSLSTQFEKHLDFFWESVAL
ncbi:MAG: helix-turn-helix domain containing protein [Helicobacteraceae bacterium]|jgi:AcrR family transcriptional regulator|nr:helix-turn-helix domain containing protein [Helicobacteraceae bacterium]